MTGFEIAILVALGFATLVAATNMTAGPFLVDAGRPTISPLVSVLIPARNEERTLPLCLGSLKSQSYGALEVIVCDDHSSDGTELAVRAAQVADPRVRLIRGRDLPDGWTGKNWTCAQLAKEARGEIMLFLDADVIPGPEAIAHTVAVFERYRAEAMSAFPEQILRTLEAKAVIPLMDVLLYCFLPLQLVHRTAFPSLVAANGQWLAFTRGAYQAVGTHEAVRGNVVEDMALARRVKERHLKFVLLSGAGSVRCAMYSTVSEIVGGFSKNFFAGFGQRTIPFLGVLALFVAIFVIPPLGLLTSQAPFVLVGVLLNLALRLLLTWRLRHGMVSVLLHPLGALAAVLIGLNGIRLAKLRGEVSWKGRTITLSDRRNTPS